MADAAVHKYSILYKTWNGRQEGWRRIAVMQIAHP